MDEIRHRLRKEHQVLGYRREIGGGMVFYSRDGFWWSGKPIPYAQLDEWVGWKDRNRQHIFEFDIIRCKLDPDADDCLAAVLWEANRKRFVLKFWEEDVHFPLVMEGIQLFDERKLQVVSHLFLNPDLMHRLGVVE
ncbi:hypothetical protein GC167_09230 [bacterium]|nr:hypothetical protein [bacterium]